MEGVEAEAVFGVEMEGGAGGGADDVSGDEEFGLSEASDAAAEFVGGEDAAAEEALDDAETEEGVAFGAVSGEIGDGDVGGEFDGLAAAVGEEAEAFVGDSFGMGSELFPELFLGGRVLWRVVGGAGAEDGVETGDVAELGGDGAGGPGEEGGEADDFGVVDDGAEGDLVVEIESDEVVVAGPGFGIALGGAGGGGQGRAGSDDIFGWGHRCCWIRRHSRSGRTRGSRGRCWGRCPAER